MLRSALRHAYGEVPMLTPTSGDVLPHLPSGPAASASHDPTPRASRKRNESSKVRPAHVAVLSLTRGQVNDKRTRVTALFLFRPGATVGNQELAMKMSPQASWRMAALLRRKAARLLPSQGYRYREMARDFEWLARAKAKLQQEADHPDRDAVRRLRESIAEALGCRLDR